MTDEMKLLMALCDALGFGVEVTMDREPRKETKEMAMCHNTGIGWPHTDRRLVCEDHHSGRLLIDKDGLYTSELRDPIVSYKLHKKARG